MPGNKTNKSLAVLLSFLATNALAYTQPALQPTSDSSYAAQPAQPATPAPQQPIQTGGGVSAQTGTSTSLGASGWISRGKTRLALGAGWGSASNGDYLLVTGGLGYFLTKGLEAGLDGEAWVGNSPQLYKVTPGLRYVFLYTERLFPYVGAFYRRIFYSDEAPLNSVGGRVGAYVPVNNRVYAGAGAVFEQQLDCDTRIYKYCNTVYPEFSISFTF
jgi:hypothetical protein